MIRRVRESMADNLEEIQDVQDKKNKTKMRIGTTIAIVAMIIAAILIYVNFIADKTFNSYSVVKSTQRDDDGNTEYVAYDGNKIIKYSHDGITAINAKGDKIWSASYEMKNPVVATCKGSVAVADLGESQLIIYDEKGNASEVEILKPILKVDVCQQGIAAVLLEDENCNYIQICDGDTLYTEIKTRVKEDGYPVEMAYSNDGMKLVTSYVKVDGDTTKSMLTFYNFSEVGKNYDSDIVKAEDFGSDIIPKIVFLNEKNVAAFASNKAYVYEMKEIPSLVFETEDYGKGIRSVAWDDSYISLISESESDAKKRLEVYSLNGKKTCSYEVDITYSDMVMSKEDVLLYNDKELEIITKNGNRKLYLDELDSISYIMPYSDENKFYMIDSSSVNLIKLEKGK